MTATIETPVGAEERNEPTADEQRVLTAMAANYVIGTLITAIPADVRIVTWSIGTEGVRGQLQVWPTDENQVRVNLRRLAAMFGLTYAEAARRPGAVQVEVAAAGVIDGVSVRFWDFVAPCTCGCHGTAAGS